MNRRFLCAAVALFAALWLAAPPCLAAKEKKPKGRDIADVIYANPILTSFAKMLQASPDLYTLLSSKGPFTVFAPTDSAFAKLKPGELDALLQPQNADRRSAILLFHIINGKQITMKELTGLNAIFSCQGNPLTFKLTKSGVFLVQKTKVSHADIKCANGNLNEVDSVLMPPEMALPPLKALPVEQPAPAATPDAATATAPAPAPLTNAVTTIPLTGGNTNNIPVVVPVIGEGARATTNAAPVQ